ncbi:ABC-2 type transport system permease protein [Amycolatopsis xylanica]|uniref:ABC-2 type transport system permease protein n=1 Tax=Amycolatopsis xylanica TaxID=589385 RepID=A0A1H3N3N9_9PSEU|nr:hypothetical protein [Amycolatopsis xylanica]SDY83095.1 ABC-2 type transport system permease protein [Amycolatopsis xylanica]
MVGVFVGMKLRVMRHALRGNRAIGTILGGVVGLAAAVATLSYGAVSFADPGTSVDLLASIYALWLLGWILGPVLMGGDESLRPEHFSLLPLSGRKLATGLLAASFVGVTTVVSLVAFAGLFVYGQRLGGGAALVGLVFTVLQLVLAVLLYRVVTGLLGALLSTRKGKDLALVVVALLTLSGVALQYVLHTLGPAIIDGQASELTSVTRALPSGWGAVAVRAAGDGQWTTVLLLAAAMVVLLAGLLLAWAKLLARRVTHPAYHGVAKSRAKRTGRALLPATPLGAVVGKELRSWWRDARRRTTMFSAMLVGPVIMIGPSLYDGSAATFASGAGVCLAFYVPLYTGNLYGFDGSGFWHTLLTPGAIRADVRGRQLAWLLIVGSVGLACCLVLPAATGHPSTYPLVLSLFAVLVLAGAGSVALQSAMAPYPLPDQRKTSNPFATGGNAGCAKILPLLGMELLAALTTIPVIILEVFGRTQDLPVLRWLEIPVGIAIGGAFYWYWGKSAVARLTATGPEILAELRVSV